MDMATKQLDWNFFFKWVGIVTLSIFAGMALAFGIMWSVGEAIGLAAGETIAAVVAGALFGCIVGLALGGAQALALSEKGLDLRRWVLYSVLGGGLFTAVAFGLAFSLFDLETMPEYQAVLLIGSALGQGIGAGQWLVLRGRVPNAPAWMGITILALTAALFITFSLDGEGREFLTFSLMALVTAIITGFGALWLFKGRPAFASPDAIS